MNAYNSEKYMKEAITSVLNQSYVNWELIFWDNNSTDNTRNILKSFNDERIKYYFSHEHTELGKARLFALNKCKGDFIAFLDTDDLWFENKLELQIPLFNDPKVGLVTSNSIFFNEKYEKRLFDKKIPKQGHVFSSLLEKYYIDIETVIIRKKSIENLDHSFDPRFNSISDYDLFMRILFDSKLALIIAPTAKWRMHDNNQTFLYPKKFIDEFKIWKDKISSEYPEIIVKHKSSWIKFENNILINEAEYFLINNDKRNSYKTINNNKFKNIKTFLIFICCILPLGSILFKLIKKIKFIFNL